MGKKQFLGLLLMLVSGAAFAFATIIARLINTTTTITAMTIAVSRRCPPLLAFIPQNTF
jgi:drug/metabolite transporter (DMT)-like permease